MAHPVMLLRGKNPLSLVIAATTTSSTKVARSVILSPPAPEQEAGHYACYEGDGNALTGF